MPRCAARQQMEHSIFLFPLLCMSCLSLLSLFFVFTLDEAEVLLCCRSSILLVRHSKIDSTLKAKRAATARRCAVRTALWHRTEPTKCCVQQLEDGPTIVAARLLGDPRPIDFGLGCRVAVRTAFELLAVLVRVPVVQSFFRQSDASNKAPAISVAGIADAIDGLPDLPARSTLFLAALTATRANSATGLLPSLNC